MTALPKASDGGKPGIAKVELGGKSGDAFARYTRPVLQLKVEGDRTCLVNLAAVAKAVALPPLTARSVCDVLLKHFSLRLGTRTWTVRPHRDGRVAEGQGPVVAEGSYYTLEPYSLLVLVSER